MTDEYWEGYHDYKSGFADNPYYPRLGMIGTRAGKMQKRRIINGTL